MSVTADQALTAVKTRLAFPLYWQGDDAPTLPDTPAAFGFVIFNNEGSGRAPAAFGGGQGANLYRNRASVEAYVFSPLGDGGAAAVMALAETVATRLRSYRTSQIFCTSADVILVGNGSAISVPGLSSEVSNYQCAVAEIALSFDQIG
jgi:hypothetical protein